MGLLTNLLLSVIHLFLVVIDIIVLMLAVRVSHRRWGSWTAPPDRWWTRCSSRPSGGPRSRAE
jgi:uncharacterized membrane protein YozB (DUF420 family)